ncbi:solute carrier family 66 member 2 isoform X2 [Marmota marmota marmota]|uniref:solute carrier family 66 member 2 isoform X2 n=1 Tax=Marmota marmota marmota TaxID=9994 RepID=UPI00209313E0|nr:solute carrier family 66 member 2 isoform X2 [Marmota marmota marmota]
MHPPLTLPQGRALSSHRHAPSSHFTPLPGLAPFPAPARRSPSSQLPAGQKARRGSPAPRAAPVPGGVLPRPQALRCPWCERQLRPPERRPHWPHRPFSWAAGSGAPEPSFYQESFTLVPHCQTPMVEDRAGERLQCRGERHCADSGAVRALGLVPGGLRPDGRAAGCPGWRQKVWIGFWSRYIGWFPGGPPQPWFLGAWCRTSRSTGTSGGLRTPTAFPPTCVWCYWWPIFYGYSSASRWCSCGQAGTPSRQPTSCSMVHPCSSQSVACCRCWWTWPSWGRPISLPATPRSQHPTLHTLPVPRPSEAPETRLCDPGCGWR